MNLGKYVILKRLGVGGMAEVFLAKLQGIGGFEKTVVIKMILPNYVSEQEYVQMFLDEARVAAHLSHPNIVQIFEIDEFEGLPFIAMEYVAGPTFRSLLSQAEKQGRTSPTNACKVIADVCLGLEHAHNARDSSGQPLRIVHRDVSPRNIVVSMEGVPKLLDFGVAKSAGQAQTTKAGTVKGRFRYMAPEQMEGRTLDRRADVFSMGVCLYFATTGRLPFDGESDSAVIHAVLSGAYVKPSEHVPNFPPRLEKLIDWALANDPDERCPSCKDLQEGIEDVIRELGPLPTTKAVGDWVGELFPDFEEEIGRRARSAYLPAGTGSGSGSGSGSEASGPHSSPSGSGPSSRSSPSSRVFDEGVDPSSGSSSSGRRIPATRHSVDTLVGASGGSQSSAGQTALAKLGLPRGIFAGVVLTLALGAAGWFALSPFGGAQDEEVIAVQGVPEVPAVDPRNGAAAAYLDEAERWLDEEQFKRALQMLKKVEQLDPPDPALIIRFNRLTDRAETKYRLSAARRALALKDPASAMEHARTLLEIAPNNQEAIALHEEARTLLAKDKPPEPEAEDAKQGRGGRKVARRSRPRQAEGKTAEGQGTLSVNVVPGGATVYLDDSILGAAPIQDFPLGAGEHRLELRANGYAPKKLTVAIAPDARKSIDITLDRSAKDRLELPPEPEAPPEGKPPIPVVTQAPPPEAAKAPVEPAKVVAPPPTAEPPTQAPKSHQPNLPPRLRVREEDKLVAILKKVEAEAVAGGVASEKARNVTEPLREVLAQKLKGQGGFRMGMRTGFERDRQKSSVAVELYPRPMYDLILAEARKGKSRASIAQSLVSAQEDGKLRSAAGKR